MAIIKTKRNSNFTTVPNGLINDSRLKWNDLGLIVYLLSKPESWSVRVDVLVKERGIGRDAVYAILKRLRDFGYARLIKYSNGSTEWTIFDEPIDANEQSSNNVIHLNDPDQENPDQENPDQDFPHVLVKKELIVNKEVNKRKNKSKEITLSEFLAECKEKNELPIPEDDPVFAYSNKVGIPIEFLRLGWLQFKTLQRSDKKQKDWRHVFREYVRRNFLKVWFIDSNGNYCLTTLGKQLQREVA